MKLSLAALCGLLVLASPAWAEGEAFADNLPKPIKRSPPVYPATAQERGIEGSVELEFAVDGNGNVVSPRVLSATPPGVFDAAALAALTKWKYEARGTETTGLKIKLTFKQQL